MDWTQVLTIVGANIGLAVISIGTTITLFLWARHEAAEDRKIVADDRRDVLNMIRAIQDEMKDFHGRLERIDEEFKGKLALQDAEFKSHLIHYHKS